MSVLSLGAIISGANMIQLMERCKLIHRMIGLGSANLQFLWFFSPPASLAQADTPDGTDRLKALADKEDEIMFSKKAMYSSHRVQSRLVMSEELNAPHDACSFLPSKESRARQRSKSRQEVKLKEDNVEICDPALCWNSTKM